MKFKNKIILGSISTIVLGAIGSGIWEAIMKPSCLKLWSTFLNIITLGISTTKDSVYCSISKGFHETPSIEILSICYSLQFGIPLACIIAIGMRKIKEPFVSTFAKYHTHKQG